MTTVPIFLARYRGEYVPSEPVLSARPKPEKRVCLSCGVALSETALYQRRKVCSDRCARMAERADVWRRR